MSAVSILRAAIRLNQNRHRAVTMPVQRTSLRRGAAHEVWEAYRPYDELPPFTLPAVQAVSVGGRELE